MQSTFLSGPESAAHPMSMHNFHSPIEQQNLSIYSGSVDKPNAGFSALDNTQSTFKKRTTSLSKPVDRDTMDTFRSLVDACHVSDWQKRIRAIDELHQWTVNNAQKVRSSSSAAFIQLVDVYCQLIQDNNAKVQSRAQQSLDTVMGEVGPLFNSNLTLIV